MIALIVLSLKINGCIAMSGAVAVVNVVGVAFFLGM
ncbi:hypothetical protein SAMN05216556_13910 [Aequorivita viscosa]|nr:hypothetical protein SAMN05216556_13910 [Aequorivita viscosa]